MEFVKSAKNRLQELCQAKGEPLPEYSIVRESNGLYSGWVTALGKNESCSGSFSSKKEATQNAAKRWLERHDVVATSSSRRLEELLANPKKSEEGAERPRTVPDTCGLSCKSYKTTDELLCEHSFETGSFRDAPACLEQPAILTPSIKLTRQQEHALRKKLISEIQCRSLNHLVGFVPMDVLVKYLAEVFAETKI